VFISIRQQTAVREAGRFLAVILLMAWQAAAGTWGEQQTIGDNGYSGSIAIDNVGNLTSVWAQSPVVTGTPTTQILASSTGFGLPWSTPPVNLSGVETAGCCLYPGYYLYPVVSVNSAGTVTAVYPNQQYTGSYADRPAGGNWGPQGNINGYDQFFVSNAKGDQAIVWSVGYVRSVTVSQALGRWCAGLAALLGALRQWP